MGGDLYLRFEAVLTDDEKATIQDRVRANNPSLHGAQVADMLSIIDDADGAIVWTEPFYEQELNGLRFNPDVQRIAVLTAALIAGRTPTVPDVYALIVRVDG